MITVSFQDIPHRIFLDSSTLQALQVYGGFVYENQPVDAGDKAHLDPNGVSKLEALRCIMLVAERAPFEFALSENTLVEVRRKHDPDYLQDVHEVFHYWLECRSGPAFGEATGLATMIDGTSYGYLSVGDKALIKDALSVGCDAFMTMESKLPKNAGHLQETLGIRVLSPIQVWKTVRPWAALFR